MLTQKAKVYCAPVKSEAALLVPVLDPSNRRELDYLLSPPKWENSGRYIPSHIYFTTDEKPHHGDWVMCYLNVRQYVDLSNYGLSHDKSVKKIVATTDTSLWDTVPKIPWEFVNAYIKENGETKEVQLGIELDKFTVTGHRASGEVDGYWTWKLKLRPDGAVFVLPVS